MTIETKSLDTSIEAKAIREVMRIMNWEYIGGGPYPFEPTLHFSKGGGQVLRVSLEKKAASE